MIKINNLSFKYDNCNILENINIEINDGDFLAIIGGNGTGKSTLIKCLIGLNKVENNQILIDGIDINKYKDFKRLGYVKQVQNKVSDIPITGMEYLRLISKDKKKLNEVIELLDLKAFINTDINNLSGGQKQRINIAKSLLHDIKYLILDEPNTGLDFNARKNFYQLIAKLNHEQKITVIIVSHHIDEISCQINRIYDLENNSIKEYNKDECKYF